MSENPSEFAAEPEQRGIDSTGEFFSIHAPLHAVRAGYIARRADTQLFSALIAGRSAHVIAPDRCGKSSLIAATVARLDSHGVRVAVLDLEQIGLRDGASDVGRWYYNVAYRLMRQLRIRVDLQNWWADKSILSNRQRMLEFYSDIVLESISDNVVIFIDDIQCIARLPFAEQLLISIRAAHNARATNPDFSRLSFVLLGECDPASLIREPEQSPFHVTESIVLEDFSREDLNLYSTELNLTPADARLALDRIYYWTCGHPYLSQKLARAVSRGGNADNVAARVDQIAISQLGGRPAVHNEPHMSHIHQQISSDGRAQSLLNLYGRIRKGISVHADLGSATQRRLIALGLLKIDGNGDLKIRNRLYESVFTARWANENIKVQWRGPLLGLVAVLAIVAIPFWYTQWLPNSYVRVLTSESASLQEGKNAYQSWHAFPGHSASADNLYRNFLKFRAQMTTMPKDILAISQMAGQIPDAGQLPDELLADFWDRTAQESIRNERRDDGLIASLQALVVPTPQRRWRASMLIGDDYPLLMATVAQGNYDHTIFNPAMQLLTASNGAVQSQWAITPQGANAIQPWKITALEVQPLVRRVVVDREGLLRRIGLTLNISHARLTDLRIKLIAPSGRAVEVQVDRQRASSIDDLKIPDAQLQEFIGEPLNGTWTLSVRDEAIGVAGQLVGWNLNINSQVLVEDFQRGLNIPDPVEREAENIWYSRDGRYAVARATQSDSARIWDLGYAKPVRAIAVNENETLIGPDAGAEHLLTATQSSINLWSTRSGARVASLEVGAASRSAKLTGDGRHLFVEHRGDAKTQFEIWSLDTRTRVSSLTVAGAPALVAVDSTGHHAALADYDQSVRVWDLDSGTMLEQLDLQRQPSQIKLSAGGDVLGLVFGDSGVAVRRIQPETEVLLENYGSGDWQLEFSPSGDLFVAGRESSGFQLYSSVTGKIIGPLLGGAGRPSGDHSLLAFTADEQTLLTGGPDSLARFWHVPPASPLVDANAKQHPVWSPAGDAAVAVTPDAKTLVIGDRAGHVHFLPANAGRDAFSRAGDEVSYVGHARAVRHLAISRDSRWAVSVADDHTLRVWDINDQEPRPYIADMSSSPVAAVDFSPDAKRIGLVAGGRLSLLDAQSGTIIAEFELGETLSCLAFSDNDHLYVGGDSGALRVVARQSNDRWLVRQVWVGSTGIRALQVSPNSRDLILVDQRNLAQQFSLAGGRIGRTGLQLPSDVQEVVFEPTGTSVLLRTDNWIHQASVSTSGLSWLNGLFTPDSLRGASLVFGGPDRSAALKSERFYVPRAGDGYVYLSDLGFRGAEAGRLYGNKGELLREWQRKLARTN